MLIFHHNSVSKKIVGCDRITRPSARGRSSRRRGRLTMTPRHNVED